MRRQRCSGCERPLSVCLCAQLPSAPLQTRTCVVVLQHPHEARHKLSTLPILTKCLANCHVLQGRRFQAGCSPLLDSFFTHNLPSHHALLLFPTSSAQPISVWFAHHQLQQSCPCSPSSQVPASSHEAYSQRAGDWSYVAHDPDSHFQHVGTLTGDSYLHHKQPSVDNYAAFEDRQHASMFSDVSYSSIFNSQQGGRSICSGKDAQSHQETLCTSTSSDLDFPHLVLIAVDATWQHANEMIKASAPYLKKFAIPVCLPFNADEEGFGMANSKLIIRKEPFKGCMTTLEAISSCLKVLEPNGVEIHDKLLRVLRSMVLFQASNIASHKVRMHQQKKNVLST